MKLTNFDFLVKQKTDSQAPPLCNVCWWDTPGEYCKVYNPAFLTMMLSVDGSCLFLDANKLARYRGSDEETEEELVLIRTFVDLLHHNGFHYPLALILTKCDLITHEDDWNALQRNLKDLQQHWDTLKVNYHVFYSKIPVVKQDGRCVLQARGQENALTWLVEAAKSNKNKKPKLVIADSPMPHPSYNRSRDSQTKQGVFLKRRVAILASSIVATILLSLGGIFVVERAVNSEQEQETSTVSPSSNRLSSE